MAEQQCDCGCASCPPHHKVNCTHTTPDNPIDTEPTDAPTDLMSQVDAFASEVARLTADETPRQMMERMEREIRAANPEPDHHESFTMPNTRIGAQACGNRGSDA